MAFSPLNISVIVCARILSQELSFNTMCARARARARACVCVCAYVRSCMRVSVFIQLGNGLVQTVSVTCYYFVDIADFQTHSELSNFTLICCFTSSFMVHGAPTH